MSNIKFCDVSSTQYYIAADGLSGTFIIYRKRDDASTGRYTGAEGMELYTRLKKLHRKGSTEFNNACEKEFT